MPDMVGLGGILGAGALWERPEVIGGDVGADRVGGQGTEGHRHTHIRVLQTRRAVLRSALRALSPQRSRAENS